MAEKAETPFFCDGELQSSAERQEAPSPKAAAPGGAHTLPVSLEQLAGAAEPHMRSRKPSDSGSRLVTSEDHSEEELNQEDTRTTVPDDLSILDRLGLNSGEMTEEEMEAAFVQLVLAFRCDHHTLHRRLQVEEHARDLAERNVRQELDQGRDALQVLKGLCFDSKRVKILQQLELCFNILTNIIWRISSTAEVLGAVHQEARVNRAMELMMAHVENLQRRHMRDSAELEEARRLVQKSSCSRQLSDPRDEGEMRQKLVKSAQLGSRRRVSVAVIPSTPVSGRPPVAQSIRDAVAGGPGGLELEPQSKVQRGAGGQGSAGTGWLETSSPEVPLLTTVASPPPLQVVCPTRSAEAKALSPHSTAKDAVCARPRSRGPKEGPARHGPEPSHCQKDTHPDLCLDPYNQHPPVPWLSNCRQVLLWFYVAVLSCVILVGVIFWCSRGTIFWM